MTQHNRTGQDRSREASSGDEEKERETFRRRGDERGGFWRV